MFAAVIYLDAHACAKRALHTLSSHCARAARAARAQPRGTAATAAADEVVLPSVLTRPAVGFGASREPGYPCRDGFTGSLQLLAERNRSHRRLPPNFAVCLFASVDFATGTFRPGGFCPSTSTGEKCKLCVCLHGSEEGCRFGANLANCTV